MKAEPSSHRPAWLSGAAAAVAFFVDLWVPGGYAIGVLYLLALLLLLPSRVRWHPWALAGWCTALTGADIFLGTPGTALELTLVNRAISALAIWVCAGLLARSQTVSRAREQAQQLLQRAVDAAPDAMLIAEREGRIDYSNDAATELFGLTQAELRGRTWRSLCASDIDGSPMVCVVRRPDGSERPVEWRIGEPRDAGDSPTVVLARDISERQRFEERLRATQRMEAIGKLTGGVAHDFNNVLAVIIGCAEFAKEGLAADSDAHQDLDDLRAAADSAAALTQQLLAFSRRQVIEPVRFDLNAVVERIERMLARLLGADIEISLALAPATWAVEADPSQIEQVLINLAVNARDAMAKGGKLTIETENVVIDKEYARQHPEVEAGEYVLLGVSDTGSGMPEEIRVRVFEPFFTTKSIGRGTGLGLATVWGIVKQAGGHVWVYSEPGQGSTFKIYLPRTLGDALPLPTRDPLRAPIGGNERILVVEDEIALRRILVRTLHRAGYTVLEAGNGVDGLNKLASTDQPIDLLLTDVVMPQMGGRELATKVAERQPGVRILFISGYTENAIVHHGVLDAGLVFLQKPFTPQDALRRVREVLDAE